MGRNSTVNKSKLVEYDENTDTSKCLICSKVLKGNLLGNIKRHYITLHNYSFDSEKTKTEDVHDTTLRNKQGVSIQNIHEQSKLSSRELFRQDSQEFSNRNLHEVLMRNTQDVSTIHDVRKLKSAHERKLHANFNTVPTISKKHERDHSDVFGEHVAAKHRKYSDHVKSVVEHLISQILFEADMGKHDDPSRKLSHLSSSPVGTLNNSFAESEQEHHQQNLLHSLKVSRSSSVSSESKNLESSHLY